VLTCGQGDFRLGLAAAKMNVVEIARDRLIERGSVVSMSR